MAGDDNVSPRTACRGVYGLQIEGLSDAAEWMQLVSPDSPPLRVELRVAGEDIVHSGPSEVTRDSVDVRLVGGGRLRMRRGSARADYTFAQPPAAEDLLHPYLAPAAALAQLWAGKEAFHAGAFATAKGAVLLLAEKEGGKSTTLSALSASHGLPVITDDLVVIADGAVLSGPRCLDLRRSALLDRARFNGTQLVRRGDRLRVPLPPAPAAVRIEGVVWLEWASEISIQPVPANSRLDGLLGQRMYRTLTPADELALLGLAAVPTVRLARPRGRAGLDDACAALADYFG